MSELTELAKKDKKSKSVKKSTKTAKKPAAAAAVRSDIPWKAIADLYNDDKSTAEISDTLKLTRLKTQDGKENAYPYYLTVGYLTKLANGVVVDGKTIKIVRGSRKKKAAKKAA